MRRIPLPDTHRFITRVRRDFGVTRPRGRRGAQGIEYRERQVPGDATPIDPFDHQFVRNKPVEELVTGDLYLCKTSFRGRVYAELRQFIEFVGRGTSVARATRFKLDGTVWIPLKSYKYVEDQTIHILATGFESADLGGGRQRLPDVITRPMERN